MNQTLRIQIEIELRNVLFRTKSLSSLRMNQKSI
jgi:hypothetical protein